MKATLLGTCITCGGALVMQQAAIDEGYEVTLEQIDHSDGRSERSASLGIGLPVLIREDGMMSDDARDWRGI